MGGASTRASQPPIIWIFTANGTGPAGIIPPSSLEKRFLSRCMVIPFEPLEENQLSLYLRDVWGRETDLDATNAYFDYLARGGGVRESLMRMQVDILTGAPRPVPAPKPEPTLISVPRPRKPEPEPNPAGRYIPQWKRVYGGPAGNQLNHVAKLLTAHNFEIIAKDDRSNARARAQKLQCVLVRRDAYAAAMQLVAEKG
jgi:hypothetical protein